MASSSFFTGVAMRALKSGFFALLTSQLANGRGQDMMAADHLTIIHVFAFSLLATFLLPILGLQLHFYSSSSSNHEWVNRCSVFLFMISCVSGFVSLFCILLPEHLVWKTYISCMLGMAAVLALNAVFGVFEWPTRRDRHAHSWLHHAITQNWKGMGNFLKRGFFGLLVSYLATSHGQDMMSADHLTMIHVFIISLIGTFFSLMGLILLSSSPSSSSSSNHEWVNCLIAVLVPFSSVSAFISLVCITLPEHLRWKTYTSFMLGWLLCWHSTQSPVSRHHAYISMLVVYCHSIA